MAQDREFGTGGLARPLSGPDRVQPETSASYPTAEEAAREAEKLREINGEMVKALERSEGELRYMAEKMPYTNARSALKTVRAALAKAREAQP